MEIHLKFVPGEQKDFIDKAINLSASNINQLAKLVSISPRNFRDWRNEKFNITKSAVEKISKKYNLQLSENIEVLEKRWIKNRSEKGKIGGFVFKKIYGNPATPEGRKRGGRHTLEILREKGIIPPTKIFEHPKYSKELAEFVGIMLGDGGITPLQIQITLNSIADKEYLFFVKKLCSGLFKIEPKIFKRKDCNANVVYYNGTDLVRFLEQIGLKIGNKVELQVDVPSWIKQNRSYSIACLRGLMDTDGGVFIHKYKVGGKEYSYRKICFTSYSVPLLKFVYNTLKELEFTPKIIEKVVNKKVWLYNTHEVAKYLEIVKSSNQRLNRYIIR